MTLSDQVADLSCQRSVLRKGPRCQYIPTSPPVVAPQNFVIRGALKEHHDGTIEACVERSTIGAHNANVVIVADDRDGKAGHLDACSV